MMNKATPTPLILLALISLCTSTTLPTATVTPTSSPQCERAPPHAQPADGHYRLGVAGDPDLFLPGELYTVSLQGVDSGQGPTPFTGFTIWAELSRDHSKKGDDPATLNQSLGTFQAYDAQAKIHDDCMPAVDNATAHSKSEIQVIWTAPAITAGACVRLSARAGPTISDSWSVLARKLCAAPAAPASVARQPPIVEPCCACDEAKYEVTFEGLWSRNTHPREFPPETAHAHFGEVIGATHTAQYRVWQEGRVASSGLRRLADDGATTALEKELKAESDHIRTIIKARGISWQQVAGGGVPTTFAVFRVDAKHHLVSLAAKLAPSPDWIVGVSALELCAANCTWTTSFSMPLYPYDAGTDNGLSYTARRIPTIPAAPVRALRPDWPKDVRSPFYSTTAEMRPFARLRLNRLRLYEKSCDTGGKFDEYGMEQISKSISKEGACATHAWGGWGACSVTCGQGYRMRQRDYIYPSKLAAETCRVELTQRETCTGFRRHCRAPSEYEPDPAESSGPCAVSEWSQWSPCSGCGVRARSRHYVAARAHKRCHIGYRARTIMDQAMPCAAGPCEKPPPAYVNATNFDWFFVDVPNTAECLVSSWGSWSPCSAKCGRGRRLRTRTYITRDQSLQANTARVLLAQWNRRFAQLQMIDYPPENVTVDPEIEKKTNELIAKCQFTLTVQEALCDGDDGSCVDVEVPEDVCKEPMLVGHCRNYQERWFYEFTRGGCEPFGFSGCGGNGNNFRTEIHCKKACVGRNFTTTTTEPTTLATTTVVTVLNETVFKKLKPIPSHQDNEVMINDAPAVQTDVDCETGRWLGWSECFGECEYGVKLNYRIVLRHAQSLGRPCKRLIKSRACKPDDCRQIFEQSPTTPAT